MPRRYLIAAVALLCLALALGAPTSGLFSGGNAFAAFEEGADQCRTDSEDSDGFDLLQSGFCTDHQGSYQDFCIRYDYHDMCMGPWLYELVAQANTCAGTWVDCRSLDYTLCQGHERYAVGYSCSTDDDGSRCRAGAAVAVQDCSPFGCDAGECRRTCRTGSDCSQSFHCVGGSCKTGCTGADNGAWVDTDDDEEHEDVCCTRIVLSATLHGTYFVEGFTEAPALRLANTEVEISILPRMDAEPLAKTVISTDLDGRLTFEPATCISPGTYVLRIALPHSGVSSFKRMDVVADGNVLAVHIVPG